MFKPLFTSGSLFLKGVDILLENLFKLKENGTNAKTEMMAGITTFMTMAYILAVNPAILSASGMDSGAVFTATAIASCIGTLFMAFSAVQPAAGAGVRHGPERIFCLYCRRANGVFVAGCTGCRIC